MRPLALWTGRAAAALHPFSHDNRFADPACCPSYAMTYVSSEAIHYYYSHPLLGHEPPTYSDRLAWSCH